MTRIRRKLTKEILEPLVADSISICGVMRKLGYRTLNGGSHSHLSRRLKQLQIDTSHFLGQAANSGTRHRGGPKKLTADEILVQLKAPVARTKAYKLRRALKEIGRPYKCEKCGVQNWQGQDLTLEVNHKNGDPLDNRRANLEFLCPNCHALIPSHR